MYHAKINRTGGAVALAVAVLIPLAIPVAILVPVAVPVSYHLFVPLAYHNYNQPPL